jgi:hypothetical protein
MVRRQAELSPGCRVYFRAAEPASPARSMISRAAHHPRKVRQSRRHDDSDG